MTVPHLKTHEQIHLEGEVAVHRARWRAVQTVRANVSDVAVQDELLDTLGLLDATQPLDELPRV